MNNVHLNALARLFFLLFDLNLYMIEIFFEVFFLFCLNQKSIYINVIKKKFKSYFYHEIKLKRLFLCLNAHNLIFHFRYKYKLYTL